MRDRAGRLGRCKRSPRDAGALLAEEQHALLRQGGRLDWHGPFDVVNRHDRQATRSRPLDEGVDVNVVVQVEVSVCRHRAPAIPTVRPDDVHGMSEKGVGVADDRTDVEVVLPVLDRHMESVAVAVQVSHDRVDRPVAVPIKYVATVACSEEFGIEVRFGRPWLWVRADADLVCLICRHNRTVPKARRING